jgi:hypothetical protein
MTYAEIASALRISGDAARQLVRRRGWPRTLGNHPGAVAIINVPADELAAEAWREDRPTPSNDRPISPNEVGATSPGLPPTLPHEMIEAALAAIKAAHASEVTALRERAEASERDKLAMQALADRALAQSADAAARTDRLSEQLAEARRDLAAAEAAASEARRALDIAVQQAADAQAAADAAQARQVETEAETAVLRADVESAHRLVTEAQDAREQTEALRTTVEELKAGQAMMADSHARDLAVAEHDARAAQQAASELRRAEEARKGRGALRRAWDGWRGR